MNPVRRFLFVFGLVEVTPLEQASHEHAQAQRDLLAAEAGLERAKAERDMLRTRCQRLAQAVLDLNPPAPKEPS